MQKFFLREDFGTIRVPSDFRHDSWIQRFRAETPEIIMNGSFKKEAYHIDKLIPGKVYWVRLFGQSQTISTFERQAFLNRQGSLYLGGVGMTLIYSQHQDRLNLMTFKGERHYCVSLAEPDTNRWKQGNFNWHPAPCLIWYQSGREWLGCEGFGAVMWHEVSIFCICPV